MTCSVRRFVSLPAAMLVPMLLASMHAAMGQGVPQQLDELEARVAALEVAMQPQFFDVNCGAGESVASALAQGAHRSARLTIRVTGVCSETVNIGRDDVTIIGVSPGDGLQAPVPTSNVVNIIGSHRVVLRQLTLGGGAFGLAVSRGAMVDGADLRIAGAMNGVFIFDASSVRLVRSTIEDSVSTGVQVGTGGHFELRASVVQNSGFHGIDVRGSLVLVQSTVQANAAIGIIGAWPGVVDVTASQIISNPQGGIALHAGASVRIESNSVIAGNGHGIEMFGGTAALGNVTIENNARHGVVGQAGSTAKIETGTIIRGNGRDGVHLGDTSVVGSQTSMGIQITGNAGRGIFCEPTPAVAQITKHFNGSDFSLNASHVLGNGAEEINCPGIFVP